MQRRTAISTLRTELTKRRPQSADAAVNTPQDVADETRTAARWTTEEVANAVYALSCMSTPQPTVVDAHLQATQNARALAAHLQESGSNDDHAATRTIAVMTACLNELEAKLGAARTMLKHSQVSATGSAAKRSREATIDLVYNIIAEGKQSKYKRAEGWVDFSHVAHVAQGSDITEDELVDALGQMRVDGELQIDTELHVIKLLDCESSSSGSSCMSASLPCGAVCSTPGGTDDEEHGWHTDC